MIIATIDGLGCEPSSVCKDWCFVPKHTKYTMVSFHGSPFVKLMWHCHRVTLDGRFLHMRPVTHVPDTALCQVIATSPLDVFQASCKLAMHYMSIQYNFKVFGVHAIVCLFNMMEVYFLSTRFADGCQPFPSCLLPMPVTIFTSVKRKHVQIIQNVETSSDSNVLRDMMFFGRFFACSRQFEHLRETGREP